ncbi:MAG: hypothetical protein AAB605_03095 [Patescibacteria group bacterium]
MYLKACDACKIVIEGGIEVTTISGIRHCGYHLCENCGAPITEVLETYKANNILV